MTVAEEREQIIIHMGGLGDVCLAENTIRSLKHGLGAPLVGAGNSRILTLFGEHFSRIEDIGSRKLTYLFSEASAGRRWRRIIFIGKDLTGELRRRWQAFSDEPVLFVDMFPGAADDTMESNPTWVEDYQLAQLEDKGIVPQREEIEWRRSTRVILYSEEASHKKGWPLECFLGLRDRLASRGADPVLMVPGELAQQVPGGVVISDIEKVSLFFREGGVFVSNDSGMAHLAGRSGLFTVTLFFTVDPRIWHPRGQGHHLDARSAPFEVDTLAGYIEEVMARA
jgi:hypothetical protein